VQLGWVAEAEQRRKPEDIRLVNAEQLRARKVKLRYG
jgi:hypothetical protein